MADWTKGDLVALKSGGPLMTVEEIQVGGEVVCSWFRGDNELTTGQFVAEALEPSTRSIGP